MSRTTGDSGFALLRLLIMQLTSWASGQNRAAFCPSLHVMPQTQSVNPPFLLRTPKNGYLLVLFSNGMQQLIGRRKRRRNSTARVMLFELLTSGEERPAKWEVIRDEFQP
jgi:hypothetical protein